MLTVDILKEKFGVKEDQELAPIFENTPGAISKWRKTGLPAIAERKALELMRERGIVFEQASDSHQIPPDFAHDPELWQKFDEVEQAMWRKIFKNVEGMNEDSRLDYLTEQIKNTKRGE